MVAGAGERRRGWNVRSSPRAHAQGPTPTHSHAHNLSHPPLPRHPLFSPVPKSLASAGALAPGGWAAARAGVLLPKTLNLSANALTGEVPAFLVAAAAADKGLAVGLAGNRWACPAAGLVVPRSLPPSALAGVRCTQGVGDVVEVAKLLKVEATKNLALGTDRSGDNSADVEPEPALDADADATATVKPAASSDVDAQPATGGAGGGAGGKLVRPGHEGDASDVDAGPRGGGAGGVAASASAVTASSDVDPKPRGRGHGDGDDDDDAGRTHKHSADGDDDDAKRRAKKHAKEEEEDDDDDDEEDGSHALSWVLFAAAIAAALAGAHRVGLDRVSAAATSTLAAARAALGHPRPAPGFEALPMGGAGLELHDVEFGPPAALKPAALDVKARAGGPSEGPIIDARPGGGIGAYRPPDLVPGGGGGEGASGDEGAGGSGAAPPPPLPQPPAGFP